MSKYQYVYALVLSLNMVGAFANEWQTNQRGLEYQVTSMSESDLSKSKQAIETWQRQTADFFYQLDKLGINYSLFEYQQKAFEKISFGIVYSYDPSTGSKQGVPISAVSPGSLMQKAGLRTGDIISSINGISLENELQSNSQRQWPAAINLTRELKSIKNNKSFELEVIRDNKTLHFQGKVSSLKVPGLRISASIDLSCGYLKTIYRAKNSSNMYKIQILSIDGQKKHHDNRVKLSPGEYKIEVKELIQNRRVPVNISSRYTRKILNLTVEKNKQYVLAAILNIDFARDREKYWRPEVTEEEMDCKK